MRTTVFATLALLATISSPGFAEDAADQTALAPHVEMEIIGSVPGAQWTYPNAINKRGLVVGGAKIQGVWNAFIWSRERGFDLIAESAFALDINDREEVVGWRMTCPQNCPTHGFIWTVKDGFRDLGPVFYHPAAINKGGDSAGHCVGNPGQVVPCAMRDGVLTLYDCGGSCIGGQFTALNDKGDIVGLDGTSQAFLLRRDGSLVTLGFEGMAWDINNRGTVAGVNGVGAAMIWTKDGILTAPPTAGYSVATGINARGEVVGIGDEFGRAFFWDPRTDSFVFLSDRVSEATDINDRGEIVGWNGPEAVIWRVTSSSGTR